MTVLLFARARDLAGANALEIDLASGATVGELRQLLAVAYPQLAPLLARSAFAVADEFAADDGTQIAAGSVVALIPPVSGG